MPHRVVSERNGVGTVHDVVSAGGLEVLEVLVVLEGLEMGGVVSAEGVGMGGTSWQSVHLKQSISYQVRSYEDPVVKSATLSRLEIMAQP